MIGENLRGFVADRADARAAEAMIVASNLGGIVLSNAQTTLSHSMSRPLGAHFHLHHGLANALLLPRVTTFNAGASPAKFRDVAVALGEQVDGLPEREASLRAGSAIARLRRDIGLPETLREVGVTRDVVEAMARDAMDQRARENNPRAVTFEEVVSLYSEDL
jgi:alcohol dehydrogenase class IV